MPILTVSLIIGHAPTKRFEAIVDSGSASCLFHADIGIAHGLKIETGVRGPLGGVIGGISAEVFYHKVKLCFSDSMWMISAGFSPKLSVAAILGRHGFFEHYKVTFDPQTNPPGLDIARFYRA